MEHRYIYLTGKHGKGKRTIVDSDMYAYLNQWKWHLTPQEYPSHSFWDKNTQTIKRVWLHQLVLSAPEGMQVDHISMDTLDNRRGNLRVATRSQNMMNRKVFKNSKTGYKGISPHAGGKYQVNVNANNKRHYLGLFSDLTLAIKARDEFVAKLHGEYTNLT